MKHTIEELREFMAMNSTKARAISNGFYRKYKDQNFYQECIEDIEEILEKQVPKKPFVNGHSCYVCQQCNEYVEYEDVYCKCGQKLDWGEWK